jgi:hypothetical protein
MLVEQSASASNSRVDRTTERCATTFRHMEKKIRRWSLPLGVAAFGSYVLILATTSGYRAGRLFSSIARSARWTSSTLISALRLIICRDENTLPSLTQALQEQPSSHDERGAGQLPMQGSVFGGVACGCLN